MDMQNLDSFTEELTLRIRIDPWHQTCAEEVQRRTAAFETLRSTLTPEQQESLDLYIAACEELEHAAVFVAYQIGREHQRKGIVSSALLFPEM